MKTILGWLSAHPIVAWLITGFDVLVGLIIAIWLIVWLLAHLFVLLSSIGRKDRSGADVEGDTFTVMHDESSDEIAFNWALTNRGKFAARRLRAHLNLRSKQKDGSTVNWRLSKEVAALPAGDRVDFTLLIARGELRRLAHAFEEGSVGVFSSYSSAAPKRPPTGFKMGPRKRFRLAVGPVGGDDCVTVTDVTPIDYYQPGPVPLIAQ